MWFFLFWDRGLLLHVENCRCCKSKNFEENTLKALLWKLKTNLGHSLEGGGEGKRSILTPVFFSSWDLWDDSAKDCRPHQNFSHHQDRDDSRQVNPGSWYHQDHLDGKKKFLKSCWVEWRQKYDGMYILTMPICMKAYGYDSMVFTYSYLLINEYDECSAIRANIIHGWVKSCPLILS